MRLIPDIGYGTERYPDKVARRLRVVNIAAWIVAALSATFAVGQFLDRTSGAWMPAAVNALDALVLGLIPRLHRRGPMAAGLAFERLKGSAHPVIADRHEEASILFADMAGFTARASDTAPDELVGFLNEVFTRLDALVDRHGLEKIKTTGDAYMVVSGVPAARPDHAEALADLALDMRDALAGLVDPKGRRVPVRLGIASGPVVAGIVGTRKFFYDVGGDAVNTASRMESTGEAGRIQVAPETQARLQDRFELEDRGLIEVRGKGQMRTWFLVGRRVEPDPKANEDAGSAMSRAAS